jgi:(p)ppGpp synthase/HD superfamily hydrolase
MDDLEKALAFAETMYGDQPYMVHIRGVVELAEFFGLSKEEKVVAALHDIFEDTDASYAEVEILFGRDVAQTVFILTRGFGERYSDYITRIGKSDSARRIKVCDLLYNISGLKENATLVKRYREALFYLATTHDYEG